MKKTISITCEPKDIKIIQLYHIGGALVEDTEVLKITESMAIFFHEGSLKEFNRKITEYLRSKDHGNKG